MSDGSNNYDWASSILAIMQCDSANLRELASAANLSPETGDLSDIDLSNMDLRQQDFSGWDLSHASFKNSLIAGARFEQTIINGSSLIEAQDWEKANLPYHLLAEAQFAAACARDISDLDVPSDLLDVLYKHKFNTVYDIIHFSYDWYTDLIGTERANQLKDALGYIGFSLGGYIKEVDIQEEDTATQRQGSKFYFRVNYKDPGSSGHRISYKVSDEEDHDRYSDDGDGLSNLFAEYATEEADGKSTPF